MRPYEIPAKLGSTSSFRIQAFDAAKNSLSFAAAANPD
jgi:hypothetical protein